MNSPLVLRHYRQNQILSATPLQLVLMVYDVAIVGCARRDLAKTTRALNTLIKALDMRQGDIPMRLYRLYQYCADQARQGDFDQAAHILRELASVWVRCLVEQGPSLRQAHTA
ncbi:MAG: flagellar export chaperone FliS [Anaerolineae bacterium]|nr:flagellar protein FliS [Anaerolineae bacterium]MDW8098417.1 flagellar export chaperone FliS [Anaerolineae bacterium]